MLGLGGWNLGLKSQLAPGGRQVAQVTLIGSGPTAGAQARVVDFRDQGVALVSFSHLPRLTTDHVYEVWLITSDGHPEAAVVFQPDADGGKTLVIGRDLRRYKIIAVTVEAGPEGAAAPSQTPSISGQTVTTKQEHATSSTERSSAIRIPPPQGTTPDPGRQGRDQHRPNGARSGQSVQRR